MFKFVDCNKCASLVLGVCNRRGSVYVGTGEYENSVLFAQFHYEPKAAPKT